MTVIGYDLPPPIWQLVQAAGPDSSFYWSDRGPIQKPGVGQGVPELTNLVPGSQISVEQSATSAQAISDNRGISWEGDDEYPITGFPDDPREMLMAAVWHTDNGTDDNALISARHSSTAVIVEIRDNTSSDNVGALYFDSDGNSASARHNSADTTSGMNVVVARMNAGDGTVDLYFRNANGIVTDSVSASYTGDFQTDGAKCLNLGGSFSWYLQGDTPFLAFFEADPGDAFARDLRDYLYTEYVA